MSIFNFFGGSGNGVVNLSYDEFASRITSEQNAVVLDVRTGEEYNMGHIPGAVLMDIMDTRFFENTGKLDKTKTYYVYCRSGSRSAQACRIMHKQGLENVYNLSRGLIEWRGELVTGRTATAVR